MGLTSAKELAKELAKCRLRGEMTAAAAVARRHRAEQAAKLRPHLFGGTEGQHGYAELARPGEHTP